MINIKVTMNVMNYTDYTDKTSFNADKYSLPSGTNKWPEPLLLSWIKSN